MRVKGEDTAVRAASLTILPCFAYQPLEDGQTVCQAFRMPLYTHDALVLGALHGLDDVVFGACCDAEAFSRIIDRLVVERVDTKGRSFVEGEKDGILFHRDAVGGDVALLLL